MVTEFSRQTKFFRRLRYFHALFGWVIGVLLLAIIVNSFVLTIFRVDGQSMEPTFHSGQLLPVLLNYYTVVPPERGDTVILEHEGVGGVRYVKRITGVPGDQVSLSSGQELILGPGEYFVQGDNREYSTDSRVYGPIKEKQLLGKVMTF